MRGNATYIARSEDGRCVASFRAPLLDSVFSVSFPESITGAVALHRFTRMIEHEYGQRAELHIEDSFPLRGIWGEIGSERS